MDPRSGRIFEKPDGMTDAEWTAYAEARGLVPIPKEEESRVRGMNRKERRAWAAQQRRIARAALAAQGAKEGDRG